MRSGITTLLILAGFCTHTAVAQIEETEESTTATTEQQPIEEITVIGQRTLGTLRVQIDRASDRIFDLWNEFNTDDLYDIRCRRVAATGTHITSKRCTPVYFDRAEAHATQVSMSGGAGIGLMHWRMAYHNPIMDQKWKQMVNEHPELVEAIVKHHELTEELKASRNQYFGLSE